MAIVGGGTEETPKKTCRSCSFSRRKYKKKAVEIEPEGLLWACENFFLLPVLFNYLVVYHEVFIRRLQASSCVANK
jgi:hypothetical protein